MDASGLTLSPQNFGRLRSLLRELAGDDTSRREALQRYYLSTPQLERLDELPPMRDKIQPLGPWDFEHTPWDIPPLDWSTVYDLLPL